MNDPPARGTGLVGGDPPRVGVVLCGGRSSRMGTDKATLGEPPWAHRVAAVLEDAGCDRVLLLGAPPSNPEARQRLENGRWDLLPDPRPGSGPATALADHVRHLCATGVLKEQQHLVVAACDLPDLNPNDVLRLARFGSAGPSGQDVGADSSGVAAYVVEGRTQMSLLALRPVDVRRIAAVEARAGMSMWELVGKPAVLIAPSDPGSVTDVDEMR